MDFAPVVEQETQSRDRLGVAPFISVIVPVRNEDRFIQDTIEQLMDQDYDPERFEVIVADGRSTDRTRAIVRGLQQRYGNLQVVDNPRRLSSAGRNAAIGVAQGEYVVLIDGHCQLENRQYLNNVADAFARSGADCLGRPQPLDVDGAGDLEQAIAAARSSRLGHHPDSFIYANQERFVPPQSVAVCYQRRLFDAVGGFDERFDACEDVEFNHRLDRAGYRCFFTPAIRVRYYPRSTLPGLFRQLVRYGRGRVRLGLKHPESFTPTGFVPALFVLGLIIGPFLAAVSALGCWLFVGALSLYGAIVLAFSLGIAWRMRRPRMAALLPVIFGTVHIAAGWGILYELWLTLGRRAPRIQTWRRWRRRSNAVAAK